jgi:type VI secretion system protein ImpJ
MMLPQRVVWSEGMLVSPQHFQQSDLYHENLLNSRLAALAPQTWGVHTLEMDQGALASEQVGVARFQGVLPDGTALSFQTADAEAPASRAVGAHFAPAQPALDVFLALPKERRGVPSIAPENTDAADFRRARFRAVSRTVDDLSGESAEQSIVFAQRNLSILFGDEPSDDFDTIKIAEITRTPSGALALNQTFIPPLLCCSASPFLMTHLRRLLALVTAKQRQLSQERQQRDAASVEFGANEVTRYLQLAALNAALPFLVHAGRAGDISARELYLFLIQMLGQLSTLASEADPTSLPAFCFADLRTTFEPLFMLLHQLLCSSVREACVPVPVEVRDGVHVALLNDERVARCAQFVLAAQAQGVAEEQLARELPIRAKIASPAQLPFLLKSATRGLGLQVTHRPPAEIPVRPQVAYFILDGTGEHWRRALDEQGLAIYLPPPYHPSLLKLELFGIPAKS